MPTSFDRASPLASAIRRSSCAWLWAGVLALISRDVDAGAPFLTDDPNVVPRGHYELLVFYQQTLAGDGRSGTLPGLELHYGPLERLELDFIAPIAFDTPRGEGTRRGYGDTILGFKYSLLDETESTPQIGFAPKLDLPTGNADRGLGSGGTALFLPLWLQRSRGDFKTYGGGGYWINGGSNNRNYWFAGVEAEYHFAAAWVLGGEIYHTTPQTVNARPTTGFNVGGSHVFSPRDQLLFSIGRGLRYVSETNRISSYVGYQLSF